MENYVHDFHMHDIHILYLLPSVRNICLY